MPAPAMGADSFSLQPRVASERLRRISRSFNGFSFFHLTCCVVYLYDFIRDSGLMVILPRWKPRFFSLPTVPFFPLSKFLSNEL